MNFIDVFFYFCFSSARRLQIDAGRHDRHSGRRRRLEMHSAERKSEADRPLAQEQPLHRRVLLSVGNRVVVKFRFGRTKQTTGRIWKITGDQLSLTSTFFIKKHYLTSSIFHSFTTKTKLTKSPAISYF